MGHHGGWHRDEATRGIIVPASKGHPILTGVKDIWGPSDVYRCHNDKSPFPEDCQALVMGQPLVDLSRDAEPNLDKEPLPIAWTKTWTGNQGLSTRIFHFTMGSGKDFENAGGTQINGERSLLGARHGRCDPRRQFGRHCRRLSTSNVRFQLRSTWRPASKAEFLQVTSLARERRSF